MAAVGELREEYRGKITMRVIMVDDTNKKFMNEHITTESHGLLALNSKGHVVDTLPGHSFGKEDIRGVAEKLLSN